jgi:hypothetical protein
MEHKSKYDKININLNYCENREAFFYESFIAIFTQAAFSIIEEIADIAE